MLWLLLLVQGYSPDFHPLYLSTCEIVINADYSWSGTLRIFYDDLEDALQNELGVRPNLEGSDLHLNKVPIGNYLQTHLIVQDQTEGLTFYIIEINRTAEVITVHFASDDPWPMKPKVTNDLLVEIFGSQKNMMTFKFMKQIRTVVFNKNQIQQEIKF